MTRGVCSWISDGQASLAFSAHRVDDSECGFLFGHVYAWYEAFSVALNVLA